ncbi:ECF RNA polymerase sigma factor SigW [Anaerolineales bacterium]|nr:ECF RNA polymerase sigma factor SigW [Anaerolineales bacterium]
MDDAQAIRRLKGGDLGGLAILMERYQVRAARAAFLITHDQSVAQDVVQETLIRICQRIHQFDESRPFEPYLMRSVVHAALNTVRGSDRLVSLEDESDEVESLLDCAASVESQVEYAQLQQKILNALSKLSPRQRAVIVQRYYLEMSEQEMASALDAAPGTVKWLLNAARGQLRRLLGQKGETDE